jgi:hypothetical protein
MTLLLMVPGLKLLMLLSRRLLCRMTITTSICTALLLLAMMHSNNDF